MGRRAGGQGLGGLLQFPEALLLTSTAAQSGWLGAALQGKVGWETPLGQHSALCALFNTPRPP